MYHREILTGKVSEQSNLSEFDLFNVCMCYFKSDLDSNNINTPVLVKSVLDYHDLEEKSAIIISNVVLITPSFLNSKS